MSEVAEPVSPVMEAWAARGRALFEAEEQAHLGFVSVVATAKTFKAAIVEAAENSDESKVDELSYAFTVAIRSMTGVHAGDMGDLGGPNRWVMLAQCAARAFDAEIARAAEEMKFNRIRDLAVELADMIERIYATWLEPVGSA